MVVELRAAARRLPDDFPRVLESLIEAARRVIVGIADVGAQPHNLPGVRGRRLCRHGFNRRPVQAARAGDNGNQGRLALQNAVIDNEPGTILSAYVRKKPWIHYGRVVQNRQAAFREGNKAPGKCQGQKLRVPAPRAVELHDRTGNNVRRPGGLCRRRLDFIGTPGKQQRDNQDHHARACMSHRVLQIICVRSITLHG